MRTDDVAAAVGEAVASVLQRPSEGILDVARDQVAEWDSLKHMEILFAVEDVLGIQFGEHELPDLDSVRKIVSSAERHLAA